MIYLGIKLTGDGLWLIFIVYLTPRRYALSLSMRLLLLCINLLPINELKYFHVISISSLLGNNTKNHPYYEWITGKCLSHKLKNKNSDPPDWYCSPAVIPNFREQKQGIALGSWLVKSV